MKKNILIVAAILLAIGGYYIFAGNQEKSPDFFPAGEIQSTDTVINVTENGFEPAEVEITEGDRVVWVNKTNGSVWPASNLHPTHGLYPEFDPREPYGKDQAWGFVFKKPGEWQFHDHLRPSSRGVVKVRE